MFRTARGLNADEIKFNITAKDVDGKIGIKGSKTKETWNQILEIIEDKSRKMEEQYHHLKSPELVTIAVDVFFLSLTPTLRRLGYQIYDKRDEPGGDKFTREEAIQALAKYLKNSLSTATDRQYYLLTDVKSVQQVSIFCVLSQLLISIFLV